MPENVNYKIDLYYGDIGFTSDYANVLQFEDAEARDDYFDAIEDKDTVNNTDFNNIQLSGNTVKIAFTDSDELTRLEKYNYIRILTRLYGTSSYSDKYEYGFIVDYSVISSSSNVTVVEFTFEIDLWQNYQFDFELKECNVERSHMDRWNEETIEYTRPCEDALSSYMVENKNEVIETKYTYKNAQKVGTQSIITTKENNLAFGFLTYLFPAVVVDGEQIEAQKVKLMMFPISLVDNSSFQIQEYSERVGDHYINDTTDCPTMQVLVEGTIADWLGLDATRILNLQIIYNLSIKFNPTTTSNRGFINYIQTEDDRLVSTTIYENPNFNTHGCYIFNGFNAYGLGENSKYNKKYTYNKSLPVKPQDGDNYSDTHELMLYKSPVIKRYITNYDGSIRIEIPDIDLFKNEFNIMSFISNVSTYNIITFDDEINKSSLINYAITFPSLGGDVVSDAWKNYLMEFRDTDRQLMWTNILTGGLADAGSTSISAGIGYRSNAERSFMYNTLGDGTAQNKAMAGMFDKYAKQAAVMSVAGGIAQFGANAYGTYKKQELKEQSIKNTPGSLINSGDATGYMMGNIDENLYYVELKCDAESYKQYANIFKKFGYYIGGVIKPDIKSRKYFNYIKTNGAILTGSLNQSILAKLCRIFDNGVTIWHMDFATGSLYNYDKENIERTLIGE